MKFRLLDTCWEPNECRQLVADIARALRLGPALSAAAAPDERAALQPAALTVIRLVHRFGSLGLQASTLGGPL